MLLFYLNRKINKNLDSFHSPRMDSSDFILLATHALKDRLKKQILIDIQSRYFEYQYDAAKQLILEICSQHRLQNHPDWRPLTESVIRLKDLPRENESRRFFETRLSEKMLSVMDGHIFETMEKLATLIDSISPNPSLKGPVNSTENIEQIMTALRNLGEAGGILKDTINKTRQNSTLSCRKDRGRYKVENENVYSVNVGIIKSTSPDFFGRTEILQNRPVDRFRLNTAKNNGYSANHHTVPFVNSVSGTMYTLMEVMDRYMEHYRDDQALSDSVSNIIRYTIAFTCFKGCHSLAEMTAVIREPEMQKILEKHGVVVNLDFPPSVIDEAFDAAISYANSICMKRTLHQDIRRLIRP